MLANDALLKALQPYIKLESVVNGVTSLIGMNPGDVLDTKNYPILGFYLEAGQKLFTLYVVTPAQFGLFQLDLDGNSLVASFPLAKVTRVVETISGTSLNVIVELDADQLVTTLSTESQSEAVSMDPLVQVGRINGSLITARSGYSISLDLSDSKVPTLRHLALGIRRGLEGKVS